MAVQLGLCRTWWETPKTCFLRTRLRSLCLCKLYGFKLVPVAELADLILCDGVYCLGLLFFFNDFSIGHNDV